MCTQNSLFDYAAELYESYKGALEEYLREKVRGPEFFQLFKYFSLCLLAVTLE